MVTPDNIILKLGTRDYVEEATYYTQFLMDGPITQQIQDGGRPPSWKNRKIAIPRPRFDRFRRNLAR